jgi:hypothetical protein
MNFLTETIEDIEASGHSPEDIIFIGSQQSGHSCTWEEFQQLADFEYDSDFGAAYIAGDLTIVFSDGSDMHRGEYDGSEWWEYSKPFTRPEVELPIRTLYTGALWPSLAEQQTEREDA